MERWEWMWAALVWSLPFPASPQTAVTKLRDRQTDMPWAGCSAVCMPEAAATGAVHTNMLLGWGTSRSSRPVHPPGTAAAGESHQSSSTPSHWNWGKARRSPVWQGETINKQRVAGKNEQVKHSGGCSWEARNVRGTAMQMALTVLPSACWRSWGEPTTTHRDNNASWGWKEEMQSTCLQPGAVGRKFLAKCLII